MWHLAILVCLTAGQLLAGEMRAADIRVFAAASLTDALKAAVTAFEKNSGDHVIFNFAGSSLLARQIIEGAPADVFFSADQEWMDALQKKGLIDPETRGTPLGNTLVIIVARESGAVVMSAADLVLPRVRRVALADPSSVPAGRYAEVYLKKLGLWEAIRVKVVPTENVRGALAAVESGNVEAAIVYKTDALISPKVKVALEIGREEGPDIRYAMAAVKEATNPAGARKLLGFLSSPQAASEFERFGFLVLNKRGQ